MTSTKCFLVNELVEAKRYPPIAPLSEASLSLQEIRTGVMGVSVGLLPGRCSEIMRKYIPVRDMREIRFAFACLIKPHVATHSFFSFTRSSRLIER